MGDWLDRRLIISKPSIRITPKDVYAMTVDNRAVALCISCSVGQRVEILRNGDDDRVVRRPCQECGANRKVGALDKLGL